MAYWVRTRGDTSRPHITLALIGFCVAIAFAGIYIFELRDTAFEAGGEVWWNQMRPVHSALYFMFAQFALKGELIHASHALMLDATMGFLAWSMSRAYLG